MDPDKSDILKDQLESLTNSGTWELDLLENTLSWSDGVFKMLGYEPQEFDATFEKELEIIHPQDRERSTALLEDVLQHKAEYFIEKRLISKAGNTVHVRSRATVFWDDKGDPIKIIGVFQDIREFIKSKNELKEQNSLTQDIIRKLPSALFLFNKNGKLLLWNKQVEKITGYENEEIASRAVVDLFEGEEKSKVIHHIQEVQKTGYTEVEALLSRKNRETVPLLLTASTINYKGEKCIFGTGTDISKRYSLLHELKLLVNNTEEAFMYVDRGLNIISFNHQMKRQIELAFKKELKKGMKLNQIAKPAQANKLNKILKENWEGNETIELLKVELNDEVIIFEIRFKPIFSGEDKVEGVFITSADFTERHRANKKLEKSEKKLQQVLDSSLDTLCTTDENGIFKMVSKSSEKLWGYKPEELEGKPYMDFVIEEDRASTIAIAEEIQKGKEFRNFHNRYRHKKGHVVPVVWSVTWDGEQGLLHGAARDARDQLKAEEQLRISENRFKALVQEGSDLIVILDLGGNYKYISPSNAGSGFEPEDYTGKNAFDFIHPEDIDWVEEEFKKLENQKNIQIRPYRFLSSKGDWRWMDSHVTDLLDEPSVQGIVANSRDVTETVELQQTVNNATRLAKVGGWEINLLTGEHYWSPMTKEIHEVADGFVASLDQAINFYHPDHRDKVQKALERAEKVGEPFDFEAIIITANSREKWIRAIGKSEFVEGKCVRVFGSLQDIHIRKTAEERLKNISNNIPGVLFQYCLKPDGSDILDVVSAGASEIFGYSPEECMKDPDLIWNSIEKGGDLDAVSESIEESANNLSRWLARWKYIMPDGTVRYHEGFGNPVKKADGTVVWDSIIVDITERRKVEEQVKVATEALKKYAKDLEVSNAELEQFAYVASHDLQEPLRMVSGFLTQLEKKYGDQLDEKANQYIYYAVDGAKRMRQIILDLLDFSRIGKLDEPKTEVNLNEVVEEVCLLHRKKIEELNAKIQFKNLPTILDHPSPLIQLFQNLISNALKYSSSENKPKVVIRATELKHEWKFSVEDNGIGIEKEYFAKIFNIFQRLHNKSEYSGTGMGLAIVKKIIENQNGKIWLKSEKGKGTTFYFTLPKN
jgi:PAS domain S-box-containing protein